MYMYMNHAFNSRITHASINICNIRWKNQISHTANICINCYYLITCKSPTHVESITYTISINTNTRIIDTMNSIKKQTILIPYLFEA